MAQGGFLNRWSRLKKAADKVSTVEAADAESLLENLTLDSDFGQFLREEISEAIRRKAMKTLFADPQFNVIDQMDIYIDDYTIFEPIPPEMMATLNQAKMLFESSESETDTDTQSAAGVVEPNQPSAEEVMPPESLVGVEDCDNLTADGQNVAPATLGELLPTKNQ